MNCLLVDDSYEISRSIFSMKFKQYITKVYSAIFVMIGVLRVKIKAVLISKPFQAPDKKIFDTELI